MKKLFYAILAAGSLAASQRAVVFDWGNVLATNDRKMVVEFLCESLQLSESEFEQINLRKREAVKGGKSESAFWIHFAKQKEIFLEEDWPIRYREVLKKSIGVNGEMFALVTELKGKEIRVGLLSNIDDRYTRLIRSFGFYDPFTPCLLSCEMGLEKPKREAYELLLRELNLPGSQVVFIDDKEENVEAAKQLGIDAVLFRSSEQVRSELSKRGLIEESKFL